MQRLGTAVPGSTEDNEEMGTEDESDPAYHRHDFLLVVNFRAYSLLLAHIHLYRFEPASGVAVNGLAVDYISPIGYINTVTVSSESSLRDSGVDITMM
ncbi:hypothetical protein VTI74DRAFT_1806 [Chaetomium olivicolor]